MGPTRARSTRPPLPSPRGAPACPVAPPPSEPPPGLSWCLSRCRWAAAASPGRGVFVLLQVERLACPRTAAPLKKPKSAKIRSFRPCRPCENPPIINGIPRTRLRRGGEFVLRPHPPPPPVRGKRGAERGDVPAAPPNGENNPGCGESHRHPGAWVPKPGRGADKAPTCYQNTRKKKEKKKETKRPTQRLKKGQDLCHVCQPANIHRKFTGLRNACGQMSGVGMLLLKARRWVAGGSCGWGGGIWGGGLGGVSTGCPSPSC